MAIVRSVGPRLLWLAVLIGAGGQPAMADPILTAAVNGSPIGPYFVNFDNLNLDNTGGEANSDVTVTFTGDAQTLTGDSYLGAEPYLGGNGVAFGYAVAAQTLADILRPALVL